MPYCDILSRYDAATSARVRVYVYTADRIWLDFNRTCFLPASGPFGHGDGLETIQRSHVRDRSRRLSRGRCRLLHTGHAPNRYAESQNIHSNCAACVYARCMSSRVCADALSAAWSTDAITSRTRVWNSSPA